MKYLIVLGGFFLCFFAQSQVVTTTSQLYSAINAAGPGTTITLADGTWNNVFIDIDKNATASNPITIEAQTPGAVLLTGNSRVYMEGEHLIVTGLVFQNPSNLVTSGSTIEPVIELKNCDYCKVLNNKIDHYNGTEAQKSMKFKWILADGQYNEIAYNSFIGKYGVGSIINDNRNNTAPDYLKIHHNYFAERTPINGLNDDNDQDAIRIGNSSTSLTDSYTEVYDNYFFDFFGEVEVISNKSGKNKYYNNTFRNYAGCLTLRHGNDCEVYGNYFFADNNYFTGGVRIIGENHKVYNNYIEGINSQKQNGSTSNSTGGINVSNGRLNSALNGYLQVKNTQVVNNTFVNCDLALRIGTNVGGDLFEEPENLTVANNIMYNTSSNPYQIITSPSGNSISQGNQTNVPTGQLVDDGNFHRIVSGSSPIDAAVGSYSFVTNDVLDGSRPTNVDAGAEEFGANGTKLPYTASDVGVNVGFVVAQIPELAVTPSSLNFGQCNASKTFEITSNVNWTITENIPWLTLSTTVGNGTTTVLATVNQNTSGSIRAGNIVLNETGGSLSATLSIQQSNTNVVDEIPIAGATSLGMLVSPNVAVANAFDDDLSTYWTGNPDTEPEVSITFDLGAPHLLSTIGINFWLADLWTTSFGVSVADNAAGPFTPVIFSASSAPTNSGVTTNTEQPFSLNNVTARYVKFIGLGNSSTSQNFSTIANVNIYGYFDCSSSAPCPALVIENADPIPETLYQAIEIESSGTVSNANVNFKAEDCILLKAGFQVDQGAMFEAVITDCP